VAYAPLAGWRHRPGQEEAMLEILIVVLVVLWLLGYFGRRRIPRLRGGNQNLVHVLLVIVLVLIIVRLVG
jgi:uncharacterized protein DUF5670